MRVMKFGGSSLATSERVKGVTDIILKAVKDESVIVVVSAFQDVSKQLLMCAQLASEGSDEYEKLFKTIKDRHLACIKDLGGSEKTITKIVDELFNELHGILQGISLIKEITLGALDNISSFGERLSANILSHHINKQYPSEFVDARQFIVTDDSHSAANVIFDETNEKIREYYDSCQSKFPMVPVVTGYIGSSRDGHTTTMGRNSSDYTAAIVGAAINATVIEIWTDVDGVYSADPQYVSSAFIVPQLTFEEAIELSYFGAKVLHPKTFSPVLEKNIPIIIKNTLNPEAVGTRISDNGGTQEGKQLVAKSITSIDDITLLVWKGRGEIDVTGMIERLFKALSLANIKILLILEGSPKHTLCLAINHDQIEKAKLAIQREFHLELQHQMITFDVRPAQSIIAVIGDKMKTMAPDVAGKMFQALGRVQINVNAIIQGASDRNVSIVIDSHQRAKALNLIHQSFFDEYKTLSLVLIGAGRIGSSLIDELHQQCAELLKRKIRIYICGITNSRHMILNPEGLDLSNWKDQLKASKTKFEIAKILKMLSQIDSGNVALVDCTASEVIPDVYSLFIQEGVHIITPNKNANVRPLDEWKKLMTQFDKHHTYFLCRTNVGAGLPILTVLEDLLSCGDDIYKIEGIFSGTLSYLFNHYDGTSPFADVLKQAEALSMTEPDPREDLSGMDVARKLLILARKMGWEMDLDDVEVEGLLPKELRKGKLPTDFYKQLKKYDKQFKQRIDKCKKEGKVLRYVGILKNGKATAKLEELPVDHPLALSVYSDNIVAFTSSHYHEAPLVIRGPGAGIECTTIGVFSDVLKLISKMPNI